MIVVEYKRIELDYCPKCRGVWFDSGELELMFKTSGVYNQPIGDIRNLPAATSSEKTRKCPICRQGMSKNDIGQKPPVLIDVCRRGDGLFFDGGEVTGLIKQLPQKEPGKNNPVMEFLGEVFKK
jgi:Zn-finger nucleic acid-binding protein